MNKKYIALAVIVLFLGIGAYATQIWFSQSFTPAMESAEVLVAATTQSNPETSEVTRDIVVETPKEVGAVPSFAQHYTIPVTIESTVLEAMSALETKSDFSFSGREFAGLGLLVEEIGGLKNADGFYWTLYINNTLSEKGVSSARVSPSDTVEWRYQKGV